MRAALETKRLIQGCGATGWGMFGICLGLWYVNPADPTVTVESRFCIGYTTNLGNRVARLFLAICLLAFPGLTSLTPLAFRVISEPS